jgi:hypothetical protein
LTPKAAKSAGQHKRKNENVKENEVERRVQLERGRQDATSRHIRRGKESDGWSEGETLEDKVERLKSSVLNAMMPHEEHIECICTGITHIDQQTAEARYCSSSAEI